MKDEKKEVDNSSHKFKNYWKNEGAKLKEMKKAIYGEAFGNHLR